MTDIRAYQPSFTAGVLSPALWARVDLAKYASGLKRGENIFIHPHGGASNRPGLEFVHETKDSTKRSRMIPFQFNTEQSYILEFGDLYFRIYRDGGLVLSGGLPYEVMTPYTADQVADIVFTQEADVMYLTHLKHAPRKLSRLADDNWTLTVADFQPDIVPPTNVVASRLVGSGSDVYRYVVSAVSEASGEESLPSTSTEITNDLSVAGRINRVSWDAVAGAGRYIVYKEDNGVYGYIGGTSGLTFDDENIVADLADTPQTGRNPFIGAGNYPRCSTFIEQRLAFGATENEPQSVWLSQSASYENFGYSQPSKPSDAVTFRIRARQVNEIRAMLPVRGLMLLTSGAEWIVTGGSQSDAISPSSIKIDNQGYRGASTVQPIIVGNTVLFAQDRGGVVRDFSYQFSDDSYVGKDLTILARHFFENRRIVSWAFAQAPSSVVWVILDNGKMVSLTYMKEHEVWAWTDHSSAGGVFEDVAVIAEGNEDVPYFIVRREVGGVQKRYIERLHTREFEDVRDAFFVDSGLTYEGAAAATITGLEHLEGETVVALSDGNVVRNLTVTGGAVTLPSPTTKVHIGLAMEATLQTLALDLGNVQGLGTVQGRQKAVGKITLRVENTRGIFYGSREDGLTEFKQRSNEAYGDPIRLVTGDISFDPDWGWDSEACIWIKQRDPLPMTILAIAPDVKLGR